MQLIAHRKSEKAKTGRAGLRKSAAHSSKLIGKVRKQRREGQDYGLINAKTGKRGR